DTRHRNGGEFDDVDIEHVDRRLIVLWPRGRVLGKDLSDVEVVRVLHDGRVVVDLLPLDEHLVREGLILADASQRLDQRVHVRLDDALVSAQVGPGGGDHRVGRRQLLPGQVEQYVEVLLLQQRRLRRLAHATLDGTRPQGRDTVGGRPGLDDRDVLGRVDAVLLEARARGDVGRAAELAYANLLPLQVGERLD